VTPPDDILSRVDEAIARLEQALEVVRQIPKQGQDGVRVDGIEHEQMAVTERLQSLRDDIAGAGDRTG
jgi:septation ring formation regulator EzrA